MECFPLAGYPDLSFEIKINKKNEIILLPNYRSYSKLKQSIQNHFKKKKHFISTYNYEKKEVRKGVEKKETVSIRKVNYGE